MIVVGLSPLFADKLILGIEIRERVVEYVQQRIEKIVAEGEKESLYRNISVMRNNAMKYLPNLFHKGQVLLFINCVSYSL